MKFAATLFTIIALATAAFAAPLPEPTVAPACGFNQVSGPCPWKREAAPEPAPEPVPTVVPECGMNQVDGPCPWKKREAAPEPVPTVVPECGMNQVDGPCPWKKDGIPAAQ